MEQNEHVMLEEEPHSQIIVAAIKEATCSQDSGDPLWDQNWDDGPEHQHSS